MVKIKKCLRKKPTCYSTGINICVQQYLIRKLISSISVENDMMDKVMHET